MPKSQVQGNEPCLNAKFDKMSTGGVGRQPCDECRPRLQSAELVSIPLLSIPHQAAGLEALARQLIAINRVEPTTADPDPEIVDAWTEKLGLSQWYAWKKP